VVVREIGVRRVLVAGATLGAVAGGAVATVRDGMSGPAFWAGIAVGALIGAICFAVVAVLFDVVQVLWRRRPASWRRGLVR
jgi:hypothetical protein